MTRTLLLLALALSSAACSPSKEQQICRHKQQRIHATIAGYGDTPVPWTAAELAACVAEQKGFKQRLSLAEHEYQALLDCWLAGGVDNDPVDCLSARARKEAQDDARRQRQPGPAE